MESEQEILRRHFAETPNPVRKFIVKRDDGISWYAFYCVEQAQLYIDSEPEDQRHRYKVVELKD
jgi:hypothetical protein